MSLAELITTPEAVPVVIFPLSVTVPVVVTLNEPSDVVAPTAAKVTLPDPAIMLKLCVLTASAFTGRLLKFTTPLPVDVVIVSLAPKTISLAELNTTPVAVPVVIEPLSVIVPVVVTFNDLRALPTPTVPSVTLPDPAVIIKLCVLAPVASSDTLLKLTAPLLVVVLMVSSTPRIISLAELITTPLAEPVVILPFNVTVPVVVIFK